MATCQIRVTTVQITQWLSSGGSDHADLINNGVDTPDDGRWIAAIQHGTLDTFTKQTLPADVDVITEINFRTRIGQRWLNGASSANLYWQLKLGAAVISSYYLIPNDSMVPQNYDCHDTGLSITKADFESAILHCLSDGSGWGFMQGYLRVNELDMDIVYTPVVLSVPKEVELLSKVRDSVEIESVIQDSIEITSKVRDTLEVESEMNPTIDLTSKMRKQHEWE